METPDPLATALDELERKVDAILADQRRLLIAHQRLVTAARAFVTKFRSTQFTVPGVALGLPTFNAELTDLERAIASAIAVDAPSDVATAARPRVLRPGFARLDVVGTDGGKATTESRS